MLYKYRKIILIALIGIVATISILVAVQYFNSIQKVTITFTGDVSKPELYKGFNTRNIIEANGNSLQTIESGKEYTLTKGLYALKPSGDHIKTDLIALSVGDEVVTKTLDIDYKADYLRELLESESSAITTAINAANPRITQLYSITGGQLFHHGDWYGAALVYTGTESLRRDTLRFVMKKEAASWKLLSNPPEISLSHEKYTAVPIEILKSINAVDIGYPTLIPQKQTSDHTE